MIVPESLRQAVIEEFEENRAPTEEQYLMDAEVARRVKEFTDIQREGQKVLSEYWHKPIGS